MPLPLILPHILADLLSETFGHRRHRRKLVDACASNPVQRTEGSQQEPSPPGPDAGDLFEGGPGRALVPELAMIGEGETVGLVTELAQ